MPTTQGTSNSQKKSYNLNGLRVLIVEDFPFMTELLSSMLREFGVGYIVIANDGEEAKQLIMMFNSDPNSRMPIDIVLSDWLMPKVSGVELLDWIRSNPRDSIRFMPVVLCSAYASEKVVIEGRDHGANESLVKPVSAKMLAQRLLHVIDHPRPFLKAPGFFGPDRRRKVEEIKGEDRRRPDVKVEEFHEQL